MPSYCERCGRGSKPAMSRSHSNIATKRRQHVNVQRVAFGHGSMDLCTTCVRNERKALVTNAG